MQNQLSIPNLRILLAEDNTANRLVAQSLLENSGHTVLTTEHGADALDSLDQNIFDLILLDVMMPVLDGLRTLRRIRRQFPERGSMPIFALTAYTAIQDQQRYRLAGFDAIVKKPLRQGDIEQAWQDYHDPNRAPDLKPETESFSESPPYLDMNMIQQIKSSTTTQRRADILSNYWSSMEELCKALRAQLPTALKGQPQALTEFRRTIHAIKGASLSIGAYRVAEAARLLRNAPPSDIPTHMHSLVMALKQSRSRLSTAYSDTNLTLRTG